MGVDARRQLSRQCVADMYHANSNPVLDIPTIQISCDLGALNIVLPQRRTNCAEVSRLGLGIEPRSWLKTPVCGFGDIQ